MVFIILAFFSIFAVKLKIMDIQIRKVIEDMEAVAASGKYSLDAQVRAYDLLEGLCELYGDGPSDLPASAGDFRSAYASLADRLDQAWNREELVSEAEKRMKSFEEACQEARFEAAAAASLHEFAKEVFEVWQTSGIFARRRALRELRERAGFRLESHRIGNYVAKTFDLMNEAGARFAASQQKLFSSNVSYKIQKGTYGRIDDFLSKKGH